MAELVRKVLTPEQHKYFRYSDLQTLVAEKGSHVIKGSCLDWDGDSIYKIASVQTINNFPLKPKIGLATFVRNFDFNGGTPEGYLACYYGTFGWAIIGKNENGIETSEVLGTLQQVEHVFSLIKIFKEGDKNG